MVSYWQALLLFLTSATGVSVAGIRISDIAISLFILSIPFCYKKSLIIKSEILLYLFLLSTIILCTIKFNFANNSSTLSSSSSINSIIIPALIVISATVCLIFKKNHVIQILSSYSSITCIFSIVILCADQANLLSMIVFPDDGIDRFTGLSKNPNQFALILLPVPFFCGIAVFEGVKTKSRAAIEIAGILFINLFVVGKSLFVAWFVAMIFLYVIGWSFSGKRYLDLLRLSKRLTVILALCLFASPLMVRLYMGDLPGSQEDQGETRLVLWTNGLAAWLDSPVLGHGPGHYSGLTAPYENMEAHNTLVDWLSAYGVFGGISLAIFAGWIFFISVKSQMWIVSAMILALYWQAMFHFYGRQPMFWLILAFGYLLSKKIVHGEHQLSITALYKNKVLKKIF